jgi:hypothetical protein
VSRDADLLELGDLATLNGRDFSFPALRILTPPQFLAELDADSRT